MALSYLMYAKISNQSEDRYLLNNVYGCATLPYSKYNFYCQFFRVTQSCVLYYPVSCNTITDPTLRFFYFSTSLVMISSIFTNFFLVSEENVVITQQKAHCYSTLSLRKRHYVHLFLLFQLTEEEEASSVNEGCYYSALFATLS